MFPSLWSAYLHWPWCRTRCAYCAFNVTTAPPQEAAWLDGIRTGWARSRPHFGGAAQALYFGGGTPSLCSPDTIAGAIALFPLRTDAEVTLEANPGTIGRGGIEALVDAGVNRLSIGVQTFQQHHARRLSRGHTVEAARQLLRQLPDVGLRSWSADLIFSLPDQSIGDLKADLDTLLAYDPPHVSIYGLSYEPGTPLTKARDAGKVRPIDDDAWAEQYALVVDTLEQFGLARYEVSNFAKPGHRGAHNEAVWRGGHYLGLGPGAHGFRPDGVRTLGAADLAGWSAQPEGEAQAVREDEAALDLVLSTLRHIDGLDLDLLHQRTGHVVDIDRLQAMVQQGLIRVLGGNHILLNPSAYPLADGIVARVCAAMAPG